MAYSDPCRWSTKRYLIAALAGTLVITVVVIVISVVLRPAEIHFSITSVWSGNSTAPPEPHGKKLKLTVTANNTSHSAGVKYQSVIVILRYTPTRADGVKGKPTSVLPVQVSPPLWQSPGSTATIKASALFPDALLKSDFAGESGESATNISVLVDTLVRFKYSGLVYTRTYNVRVLCEPQDYISRLMSKPPMRKPPSLPINCKDD